MKIILMHLGFKQEDRFHVTSVRKYRGGELTKARPLAEYKIPYQRSGPIAFTTNVQGGVYII